MYCNYRRNRLYRRNHRTSSGLVGRYFRAHWRAPLPSLYAGLARLLWRRRGYFGNLAFNWFAAIALLTTSLNFTGSYSPSTAFISSPPAAYAASADSSLTSRNGSSGVGSVPASLDSTTSTTATSPIPSSTSASTGTATPSASPTASVSRTPIDNTPPPTYTITLPTAAPTIERPPDTDYLDQALQSERDALLTQVNALPALTSTITGTLVSGQTGGRIPGPDGGLTVGLMPGAVAVTDTIVVQMNRLPQGDLRGYRDGQPLLYTYELTATYQAGGQRVQHFNKDAVLIFDLNSSAMRASGLRGSAFNVYTFNEQSGQWELVPTQWNPSTNQLIATTPHFSLYTVDPQWDAVKNYIPSIENFEIDLQSGVSTVQYPLNLPPGPGGFGPKITLSYNSGNMDRVDASQQGDSPIGYGWSLSSSYIAASQHHFPQNSSCDDPDPHNWGYHPWTASIVTDGINGALVKGNDGYWHTEQESFARIQYFPGSGRTDDHWEAWDKDGTHYVFDLRALVYDEFNRQAGLCTGSPALTTYKWMLHTATDVHGNVINYSYLYQDRNRVLQPTPIPDDRTGAVYPYQILYGADRGVGSPRIQVTLDVITRTINGITDKSDKDGANGIYQSYRIDKVDVQRLQQSSNQYSLLRSYQLSQSMAITLPDRIDPSIQYPHLTLDSITLKGNDGITQLPTTGFVYYLASNWPEQRDWGHLWYGGNGYGGQARFYYDAAGGDVSSWTRRVRAKRLLDGLLPNDPPPGHSYPHNALYTYDYRGGEMNGTDISAEADGDKPSHSPFKEFRGYAWVREIGPEPQQLVTDHFYSQDDVFKAKEWRTQVGKTLTFSDIITGTPSADLNWTVSGGVYARQDPNDPSNMTWKVEPITGQNASVVRNAGIVDNSGADADIRFLVLQDTPNTSDSMSGTIKLQAPNGDYWGLRIYPRPTGDKGAKQHYAKVVWRATTPGGTYEGERDLYITSTLRPRWPAPDGFGGNIWYRIQLHTSPDGRMALELYQDNPTDPNAAYKDYVQIKSGDQADFGGDPNGLIPTFPMSASQSGTVWTLRYDAAVQSGQGVDTLVDDYHEWRTLYTQSDSTYQDLTDYQDQAQAYSQDYHVGTSNNCQGMNIRFVPSTSQQSTKLGEGSAVGQVKRERQTFGYQDPTYGTRYGNLIDKYEYGDLDATGDESHVVSLYAVADRPANSQYIVDKVGHTLTYSGTVGTYLMAEQQFFYDGDTNYGEILAPPQGKGDLTQFKQVGAVGGVRNGQNASQFFHYDAYGNKDQVTDPNSNTTTTQYDPFYFSFPMTVTHPLSPTARSEYTYYDFTLDTVSATVDMNGMRTEMRSDVFGRPSYSWVVNDGTQTNPNERYVFADTGQAGVNAPFYISYQKLVDASTNQYQWATRWFDARGRTVQDVSPKDNTYSIVVDSTYTNTGVISSTTKPYLVTNTNPTATITPDTNQPKTVQYNDQVGRLSYVTNPDQSQVIYDYSMLQWTGVRDEEGRQKWQRADMLGRTDLVMEQSCPPCAGFHIDPKVAYSYDVLDRLTQVTRDPDATTSAGPVVTTIQYDGLGRKSQMQDPDMGQWQYEYDAAGNMTVQRDALYLAGGHDDHQLFMRYDTMNRVTQKFYGSTHYNANQPDVQYLYDNALGDASTAYSWGKLRQVNRIGYGSDAASSNGHGYTYDFKGRPYTDVVTTTTYSANPYTVSYAYDSGDRLTRTTYPSQAGSEQVSVGYNTQGMGLPQSLTSSISGNPNPVYSAAYNERGQLSSILQGSAPFNNGITTQFQYNVRGWLTNTLATVSSGSTSLLNLSTSYFLNGNISSVSNQNITGPSASNPTYTNTFSYDWLNRLSSATSTSTEIGSLFASEQFQFDNLSRMTTRTISGKAYNYTYGNPSHIDAPTYYDYTKGTYGYDAAGNQITGTVKSVSQTRSVDPENRISSIVTGTTTLSFVYDGNGKRLLQAVTQGSSTTRTLYVGNLYEETISAANHPYIAYYYLGPKMVGERKGDNSSTGSQYRIVGDHLGSTTLIVDTASPPSVVYRSYYKPYGEVAFSSGQSQTTYGYTGQRLDGDSGLMYYGARYYDPILSLFVAPDPTTPDRNNPNDYNKYLYVRGNPLRYLDSLGLAAEDHYVFVNGCLNHSSTAEGCVDKGWDEYLKLLEEEFDQGHWGLYETAWGSIHEMTFGQWAATHVHFVGAPGINGDPGAANIEAELKKIQGTGFNIHLIGHSMGGTAIARYLDSSMSNGSLDTRISDATLIDPGVIPRGLVNSLGDRAGDQGVNFKIFDTRGDGVGVNVGGCPADSLYCEGNPDYSLDLNGQVRTTDKPPVGTGNPVNPNSQKLHEYTMRHVADQTRKWLDVVWR